jgi:spore coat protein CotH
MLVEVTCKVFAVESLFLQVIQITFLLKFCCKKWAHTTIDMNVNIHDTSTICEVVIHLHKSS